MNTTETNGHRLARLATAHCNNTWTHAYEDNMGEALAHARLCLERAADCLDDPTSTDADKWSARYAARSVGRAINEGWSNEGVSMLPR